MTYVTVYKSCFCHNCEKNKMFRWNSSEGAKFKNRIAMVKWRFFNFFCGTCKRIYSKTIEKVNASRKTNVYKYLTVRQIYIHAFTIPCICKYFLLRSCANINLESNVAHRRKMYQFLNILAFIKILKLLL